MLTDSFGLVTRHGEAEPPQPFDMERGRRMFNRMMASLEKRGIDLSYTALSSLDDSVNVDDGAYEPLVNLFAIRLFPYYYSKPIPEGLVAIAKSAIEVLNLYRTEPDAMEFPDVLPVGSGTEGVSSWSDVFFYVEDDS